MKASAIDAYDYPCTGEQNVRLLKVFDVLKPFFFPLDNVLPYRPQNHQKNTYLEFAMFTLVSKWFGLWWKTRLIVEESFCVGDDDPPMECRPLWDLGFHHLLYITRTSRLDLADKYREDV